MRTRRSIGLLLALIMAMGLTACAAKRQDAGGGAPVPQNAPVTEAAAAESAPAPEAAPAAEDKPAVRVFTDSVGREVELPARIDKAAVSGPLAQIVLFALCPDRLVGLSDAWSKEAQAYLDEKYLNMPQIGQLYGGKGELNLETLLQSGAQVVVDVGEPKGSIREDLDALQEQTGIPFVHITATLETSGDAYRKLGELMGMPDEAEALADYCEKIYDRAMAVAAGVEKANVLYVTGSAGQNVIARGSYHAEIIDLLTNNLAVVDAPSSKGSGNEVSMEQILAWNPDAVIFSPDSIYSSVRDDAAWQSVAAVKNGAYYEAPFGPYNWMGFPPSVQRFLGMLWLTKVLYPEATAQYDLFEDVHTYYQLFYHCDLTRAQYDALVAHSLGK